MFLVQLLKIKEDEGLFIFYFELKIELSFPNTFEA